MTYVGVEELRSIEQSLANYNADIISKFRKFLQSNQVLDFGAGVGTLAKIWREKTGVAPDCLEIDFSMNQEIKTLGFVRYSSLDEIKKKYDAIYSSNVLEHIKDDVETLIKLNSLLKKNGLIAIYVPAFSLLTSDLDKAVGHVRRYEKKELIEKLAAANFSVLQCCFSDSIGFFASLFIKFFGYQNNAKKFLFYDKYIYPISSLFDRLGAKYFFGKNLLVIARKNDD
jgi:2-polyprenyl-3-methyl-5-hydroxy-6-metoxy-1,4-benzoquinol methylase